MQKMWAFGKILSADQVNMTQRTTLRNQEFKKNGFEWQRHLVSATWVKGVHEFLQSELEPTFAKVKDWVTFKTATQWERAISELETCGKLATLDPEFKNILCGHFRLETRLNPRLTEIVSCDPLLAHIRNVLQSEKIYLHMPPVARYVLPQFEYAAVPVHQDLSYNQHMKNFVTVWLPLVPIDAQCGGVEIFEGRPNQQVPLEPIGSPFWFEPAQTEGKTLLRFEANPGDVLFLDPYVLHQSGLNKSDRIRFSIDYRFFTHNGVFEKHALDCQTGKLIQPGEMI